MPKCLWSYPSASEVTTLWRYTNLFIIIIIIKLRSTYDRRLIHKTSYEGTFHLQYRKIIWDSVRTLAYDIPKRNLSTLYVIIVSRSYDKLKIILG